MKKNEEDNWLIENWGRARQLETAMNATRERYEDLFTAIHKSVKQNHTALHMKIHMRPRDIREWWGGSVVFSKAGWPPGRGTWRTGFYISNISLDELASDKIPEPVVSIWFGGNKNDKRIEDLRRRITTKAPQVFKDQKVNYRNDDDEDNRTLLLYPMPEGKKQLLKMLYEGKEKQFKDCIANHINLVCGFIRILDELLTK